MAVSKPTGQQCGAVTVVDNPRTAAEAEDLALQLVGSSLPPCVQAWLIDMEQHSLVVASILGKRPPETPVLTAEER